MKTVVDSLTKQKINFEVFDQVTIEPTEVSFKLAIDWAKAGRFDSYLAVGEWVFKAINAVATQYAAYCMVSTTRWLLEYNIPNIMYYYGI